MYAVINDLAKQCAETRAAKGFVTSKENMLGKLMLVVEEVSEAARDVRHENWNHFGEEVADAIIRLFDIAHTMFEQKVTPNDLEYELLRKMEINAKREYLHGTKSTV